MVYQPVVAEEEVAVVAVECTWEVVAAGWAECTSAAAAWVECMSAVAE